MLVSIEHRALFLIEIGAAVVVEIITRRVVERRESVVLPLGENRGIHFSAQLVDVGFIGRPCFLSFAIQTIQTHVLLRTRTGFVAEGSDRAGGTRYVAPHGGIDTSYICVGYGQTVLKRFLAIAEYILADITEVDIHLTFVAVRVGQRRIHHPELDIFDVGFFEISVVESAHHTAPALFGIGKPTVGSHFAGRDIILTTFFWIEREVENRQFGIHVAGFLAVGINLVLVHNTRAMVAECVEVVFDMRRCVGLRISEDRINAIPCHQRAVLVVTRLVDVLRLVERGRRRSQEPITRIVDVDIRGRTLEIINISRSHGSHIVGMTRDKVCKLGVDLERRRCCSGYPRNLVDGVGKPLHFGFPTAVNTPNGVSQRL